MQIQFESIGKAAALLKVAASFCSRYPEALNYLTLDATAAGLVVTANGEDGQFVLAMADAVVTEPGALTVRADLLSGLFAKNTHASGRLTATSTDDAVLKVGRNSYKLKRLAAELAPAPARESPAGGVLMPADQFTDALSFASHAMGRADVRYYLNGCYINVGVNGVEFAATDGHRLARTLETMDPAPTVQNAGWVIVPAATVPKIMAALAATGDEYLRLSFSGGGFCLCTDTFALHGKSIDGRFPDVNAVIPQRPEVLVTLSAKALIQTLDRTGLISAGAKHPFIDCRSTDEGLVFSYEGDLGSIEEHIDGQIEGTSKVFEVRLNPHYLRDAAMTAGGGQVVLMGWPDPNRPIRWEPAGVTNHSRGGVIMPLRR